MIFDILFTFVLLLGFYAGYTNGVLGIILKILLIIGSFFLALYLFPIVFLFLENTFTNMTLIFFIIGFLIVFLTVFAFYKFSSNWIERLFANKSLRILNKIFGGVTLVLFIFILSSIILGRLLNTHILKLKDEHASATVYLLIKSDQEIVKGLTKVNNIVDDRFNKNVKTLQDIEKRQNPEKKGTK